MTRPETVPPGALLCLPLDGLPEVVAGDDLGALISTLLGLDGLRDGDVLAVTSKVVSKAEGRSVRDDRSAAVASETGRTVARRGATSITRTRHGLVMAAAGVDASNTEPGTVLLLPTDPDASARALRNRLRELTGRNVAVLVTDTAGRAWRHGQTDLALGAAGIEVLHDYAGTQDGYGNVLAVTAPAVADEIASAADLVKGKLARRPVALVRGLERWVLPADQAGAGAGATIRAPAQDWFGFGAREAVLAALRGQDEDRVGFGAPADAVEVRDVLEELTGAQAVVEDGQVVVPCGDPEAATTKAAAYALGWRPAAERHEPGTPLRFVRATP